MLIRILLLFIVQLAFVNCSITKADKNNDTQKVEKRIISKSSAISAARNQVKGKVLSAKLIKSRGPAVYRVKMLVGESRIRTVFVDGTTARVIRIN